MLRRVHPLVQMVACVCVAVVAGVSVQAIGTPRMAPMSPPSPLIATIDVSKVLEKLKERESKLASLDASASELKKKAEEKEKALEAEAAKIELMPNDDAKLAAAKAWRAKRLQARFDLDYGRSLLDEQQTEGLVDLYNKICTASAELAKARGIHLVLANDTDASLRNKTGEDVQRIIALRKMIYADGALDITEELASMMNNQYAVTGGSAPKKP